MSKVSIQIKWDADSGVLNVKGTYTKACQGRLTFLPPPLSLSRMPFSPTQFFLILISSATQSTYFQVYRILKHSIYKPISYPLYVYFGSNVYFRFYNNNNDDDNENKKKNNKKNSNKNKNRWLV